MLLLVKRSCFKCIPKGNEENTFHGRRQLGRLLNKLANSKGVSVGCGASHAGRGRGGVWRVSTISVFCQKESLSSGAVSAIQRSAVNLKSNACEHKAALRGEAERCQSYAGSIQSLNNFIMSQKLIAFKNAAHGCYEY